MRRYNLAGGAFALAGCLLSAAPTSTRAASAYAESVLSYSPGTTSPASYRNPDSILGAPSRISSSGGFESPVSPFAPAWTSSQLVSVGAGGSITVRLSSDISDAASNPFGVDFILFGNNGFKVDDFSVPEAEWTTDGTLFTFDPPGASKVWVSENDFDYFELRVPAGASATVDGLFPTDGAGIFTLPVNPALQPEDFAGRNIDGIRSLYAGSAGGTGFDLAWARKADGTAAALSSARYVRIEVFDGKVELDAIVVVPEPRVLTWVGLAFLGLWRLRRPTTGPWGSSR